MLFAYFDYLSLFLVSVRFLSFFLKKYCSYSLFTFVSVYLCFLHLPIYQFFCFISFPPICPPYSVVSIFSFHFYSLFIFSPFFSLSLIIFCGQWSIGHFFIFQRFIFWFFVWFSHRIYSFLSWFLSSSFTKRFIFFSSCLRFLFLLLTLFILTNIARHLPSFFCSFYLFPSLSTNRFGLIGILFSHPHPFNHFFFLLHQANFSLFSFLCFFFLQHYFSLSLSFSFNLFKTISQSFRHFIIIELLFILLSIRLSFLLTSYFFMPFFLHVLFIFFSCLLSSLFLSPSPSVSYSLFLFFSLCIFYTGFSLNAVFLFLSLFLNPFFFPLPSSLSFSFFLFLFLTLSFLVFYSLSFSSHFIFFISLLFQLLYFPLSFLFFLPGIVSLYSLLSVFITSSFSSSFHSSSPPLLSIHRANEIVHRIRIWVFTFSYEQIFVY